MNDSKDTSPAPAAVVIRPWGSFAVLARGDGYQVKRIIVNPGQRLSLQYHHHRSEHWVVAVGPATITVDDRVEETPTGGYVFIPRTSRHRLANDSGHPITIIEIQQGDYLGEDDIVRLEDDYQRQ